MPFLFKDNVTGKLVPQGWNIAELCMNCINAVALVSRTWELTEKQESPYMSVTSIWIQSHLGRVIYFNKQGRDAFDRTYFVPLKVSSDSF